jgi:aspartyl-tRNA(Asn)/glutamyl-tRNA(Gln) amidotransferase subunit A
LDIWLFKKPFLSREENKMNKNDICFTSATDLARLVKNREISPVEIMEAIISRIEQYNVLINAFSDLCLDNALKAAQKAESDVVKNDSLGPLHGVPFSVKDLLITKDVRTTFGSYIFENNIPDEDAPCVHRLKKAGGILIGKTTTPEFGHKALTDSPLFGITRNPWNLERTPGGSSGGASAAVAAGLGPLAVGTDGGGSVRIPASCTGIIGLKPTLGRVPHPQSPDLFGNLSHIGPMTRTISDAALTLDVMAGPDIGDPHSYGLFKDDYQTVIINKGSKLLKGMKVAWSATLGNTQVESEVLEITKASLKIFDNFGCEIEEVAPDFESFEDFYLVLMYSNLAARLNQYVESHQKKIDPSLRYAIEKGNQYAAPDLQKSIYMRSQLFQKIQHFFNKFDLLITPTLSSPAIEATHNALDPITVNGEISGSLRGGWYPYTHPFNMSGNPAISIPCGWTKDDLPVGLQIVGPWMKEKDILLAAAAIEVEKPWSHKRPSF